MQRSVGYAELEAAGLAFEHSISVAPPKEFHLDRVLFGKQLAFAKDKSPFATADCSRRAGKSVGVGAWLLEGPLLNPKAPSLYFTLTRKSAKRIIWGTLLDLNRTYNLGFEANESDLILKRNGRGAVYLTGVNNKDEIEKIRGSGWGRAAGDESQTLPEYMRDLVEDVLMPSFMDFDGMLRMAGTPAPVPAGFFYDITHDAEWSHHAWTVWDNPHIPEINKHKILARTLKVRGVTIDHPSIRREFFGEWAFDFDALVFKYDPSKNVYGALPNCGAEWQHVIGVDLGYDDADAIAVLGFNTEQPAAYLREESVLPKQTITQLSDRLREMVEKYKPNAVVVDTGGLGRKIVEEVSSRTMLPLQAAEKTRKFEFIELLNDSLRSGRFMVKADSRWASDVMKIEWDRDKSKGDHLVVSDRFHSDVADAVLYAFRESLHWMHKPKPAVHAPGTPEWAKQMQRKMFEKAQADVRRKSVSDFGDMGDWGGGVSLEDAWGT